MPAILQERHESALGQWQFARRDPIPELRGIVRHYSGWFERTPAPLRRRQMPIGTIPVILSFGPPFTLLDPHDPDHGRRRSRVSFVAGIHDEYAVVEHDGLSHGVEIYFTPLGARRVLGLPLRELTNQVVPFEDVLGEPAARELVERLALAPGWAERFALLDTAIGARLRAAREPAPSLAWAWRRLEQSGGRLTVGALAQELGCSRRHLVGQVHEQLGLPPKTFARILRFNRAVELLGRDDGGRLGEIALDCGYYDQAHLNRDFRAFAGDPPSAFLARRLPDGAGFSAA
ncbi:helix-turn-helix domain-containing protein [Conexibacter sp. JD483]|uniref:helix-turn-helix domain-containing protein n=1 Tax=unclassified Conexibacter TaxID=2627773 RepID=UPI0027264226|nr:MULTISPECIES: helix-turn-helix domain-containing protein [unclassified Conexibacter]MDO8188813.1 helix-turn-helix domain-containing protein [Conexibacter sp. CPCC 205706]MDO8201658.1 helix-turn-helix domain-containing protein [Conexibacter sp. CPCC 205762]MDR9371342.1 helix-turn-helix domain-containing protein [Conexibacter sp. JD483]